jgi:hypothetical protein
MATQHETIEGIAIDEIESELILAEEEDDEEPDEEEDEDTDGPATEEDSRDDL